MKFIHMFAAAVAVLGMSAGLASAEYPDKAVRIVFPFGAGGSGDIINRLFANKLSEQTGKTFIVENKTGAGGRIGYGEAARSVGDGYTLAATDVTYTTYPSLFELPWNHKEDLVPVATYVRLPWVFVTRPDGKFKTMKEMVEFAKANPGTVSYSSSGIGAINHLVGEMMASKAGIKLTHVPFKATGEAMQGLLSGTVDIVITGLSTVVEQIEGGKLVGLAHTGADRWYAAPAIPTLKESDIDAAAYLWYGLSAPKGTPDDVVNYLNKNIADLLKSDDMQAQIKVQGVETFASTPEEMGKLLEEDTARWAEIIKEAGIVIQ